MADNYEIEVTLEETFGTGIRSVEQTGSSSVSGGLNEITVTLTNDQENKFYIMNGEKGADGRDGSSPIAVTSADQMTDTSQIYLYGGSEEGYIARHLYYWNGSEWADYGLYGMPDTYLSSASIENETALDEHGNTVSTSRILGITGRILSNPAYYEFVQKLYSVSGENEDGALTQKATSEAIEAAQFLPILNHPIAPVGDNILSVTLEPNVLNQISGIGYTFTDVTLVLNGAKANTLTRYFVRFTTGGNAVTFAFPSGVTVPSGFSLKTQTTYDIVIENNVAHIWEDGNAVGNVLDAEATADAVADWLDDHPEATTTVADGSITTAKLATGVIDNTLLVSGAAADSAKVGQELSDLKSQISDMGSGIPYAVKVALDTVLQNVGFKNTDVYTDELATIHAWATDVNLVSITATYTQSETIYNTDTLDYLKNDLVVTANYDNGTSVEVDSYELSGELTVGTSAITVTYLNKTTTFNVTVTKRTSFIYTPADGILSEQRYITCNKASGANPTESIVDGKYVASTKAANWAQTGFEFKPAQFTTAAKVKVTFSILSTAYLASGNTTSLGFISFCVTDGTYSAAIGFPRYNSNSANIRPRILTSTPSWAGSSFAFAVNTTHTAEIIVRNNTQTIKLDDVDIITDQPLAEFSLAKPSKFNLANSNSASSTQSISIERLEYYIDEGVE